MTFDQIRLGDLFQCVPAMPFLPAARLAGFAAKTAKNTRRLLQPIARRRLAAVRTVLVQLPPKVGDLLAQRHILRPQNLNFALKRGNQLPDLGRENHSYLDSYFARPVSKNRSPRIVSKNCGNPDSPRLGITVIFAVPRRVV